MLMIVYNIFKQPKHVRKNPVEEWEGGGVKISAYVMISFLFFSFFLKVLYN